MRFQEQGVMCGTGGGEESGDPAAELVARRSALHQPADDLIRAIYDNRAPWAAARKARRLKSDCVYATLTADPPALDAWQRLLGCLGYSSCLLSIEPGIPGLGLQPGNTYMDALLQVSLRWMDWLREPEGWVPSQPGVHAQLAGLVRWLFARYPVPAFLEAAWLEGFTGQGESHRGWFLLIGRGQNLRLAADCPVRLTRMQAHHFMSAPDHMSIVGALRWGQARGLGADEPLAESIATSRLGSILPDEAFWQSVIQFFVNHRASLEPEMVGPIVDFVWHRRVGLPFSSDTSAEEEPAEAPEPTFSMKGRTSIALQRRVEEWRRELADAIKRPARSWNPSGIAPFSRDEPNKHGAISTWTIQELLDSEELHREGYEMHHCVYTYTQDCLRGGTSIWSLRVRPHADNRTRRLFTIEVDNRRRTIVQVRGRCNARLISYNHNGRRWAAKDMLERWAQEQGLAVNCGL